MEGNETWNLSRRCWIVEFPPLLDRQGLEHFLDSLPFHFSSAQSFVEQANADADVAAAFARAQKSHKHVLIDLGANWCVDCIVLANFIRLPEINRFVEG